LSTSVSRELSASIFSVVRGYLGTEPTSVSKALVGRRRRIP